MSVNDIVDFFETGSEKHFATAKLTQVIQKPLGELNKNDKKGHEFFSNDNEMYQTYARYYKKTVDKYTLVKVIRFMFLKKFL